MKKISWSVSAILSSLLVVGCGDGDHPQIYRVRGTVTLDGAPVSSGGVRFSSPDGRLAIGKIQTDGSYSLATTKWGQGALPGSYRVSVQVRDIKPETDTMPAWPGASRIPEKYEDPTTSGLEFEVVAGENQFDIKLFSGSR